MKKVLLFLILLMCPVAIFAAGSIEINTASLQQLDQLTGIGPTLAQRIVDARPFSSVDDLLRVKGIGAKTLQKIKDQGLAYIDGQIQNQPQQTTQTTVQTQNAQPQNTTGAPQLQPQISPAAQPATEPAPAITYPSGVIINEILPSPKGADETNEWIELYNSNNALVDVSNWKLQDTQGTIGTYIFPNNSNIKANGYVVLKRPDTNIMLNNDEDGLNLIFPNETVTSSMSFTKAPRNQSYNYTESGWQWSATLTPASANIITALAVPAKTPKKPTDTLSKTQKTDSNIISKNLAADVSGGPNPISATDSVPNNNPWLLFSAALGCTIIFAVVVLLLKLKILKKNSHVGP
jgi:competence ComEA-like helix-hairpin-helix protein